MKEKKNKSSRAERRPGKTQKSFSQSKRRPSNAPKKRPYDEGKASSSAHSSAKVAPQTQNTIRSKPQGVLLWGVHAVHEAWLNPKRACHRLWLTQSGAEAMAGALAAAKLEELRRPTPRIVDRRELDRLVPPGTVHQGVILETDSLSEVPLHALLKVTSPAELVIVLDQVTDPHNVGAVLRSAAAFGAGAVIMTERNAPSTTGVLAKAASGAVEHVSLIHVTNLSRALEELQEAGYWCVGLAEEAKQNLGEMDLTGRTAIVLGNEGDGMRRLTREHCDDLARLPTAGPIGSLNVSNAAAIALYEVRRQKPKDA